MQIIDGKKRAAELRKHYEKAVQKLKDQNIQPKMQVITVGDDPASQVYVGQKEKMAKRIGFDFDWQKLDEKSTQEELMHLIQQTNEDPSIHGVIVQLPLPDHLDSQKVMDGIDPKKDIDGFHPYNVGRLMLGDDTLVPCTPRGILNLLDEYNVTIPGADVAIIGRSKIVGQPLANLLINRGATVSVLASRTKDVKYYTKNADIVIVAVGKAHLIDKSHLKEGAVVIDVGINRLDNGKLAGDVDFESAKQVASAMTPVPGGVGPMTVAMLMEQAIICACQQNNLDATALLKEAMDE
ncbi:bifunctional 5,10-methylenetetrahydrofolate dehydrogenase/5,10-methenyltetrahydrofolate cyclohydrolase [Dolosicoccus paucivorans]|uniref:Bifunctional protein FolD n=1 Tax=Dolosicoccus paucivorans TaxID=84521 RepID=A0A1G8IYN8_9LACT|nr:tetrahydrofolate dehydrogenase/cyclohydrolase catalytic domain-containing protein [Dolosicoccus paucivorans]PMB84659.1 bifunctional methylenetetrahydrofolate dehydrogenase/methenyltetrahydrofolate cyclohydrolase [Dolosicoccus paucivorans]PMC59237.1 bifunctional methylenetetrahydrofolate dehydrogenase/methenyltetrahydrofolate cyclohydrolase [Dolosicoccus paucivorans]SDI23933.1 methylenetetrahydrofolate dehydrogenase (NADP+) / methenyltetrahydrofolate cyclohydrolase [Dolosicoccus paucivorans]